MAQSAGANRVTFRIIDLQPDKIPAAFEFVDYKGSKWYLEHPIGRAVAIQQLRVLLRLWKNRQIRTIRILRSRVFWASRRHQICFRAFY